MVYELCGGAARYSTTRHNLYGNRRTERVSGAQNPVGYSHVRNGNERPGSVYLEMTPGNCCTCRGIRPLELTTLDVMWQCGVSYHAYLPTTFDSRERDMESRLREPLQNGFAENRVFGRVCRTHRNKSRSRESFLRS